MLDAWAVGVVQVERRQVRRSRGNARGKVSRSPKSQSQSLVKYADNSARNISAYQHVWITYPRGFSNFREILLSPDPWGKKKFFTGSTLNEIHECFL